VADVVFTDAALDDLRRIGPSAIPTVLKKVLLLATEPEAGYPLGGDLTGYRKLVAGRNTWRIVYRITDDKTVEICEVWAIGPRADEQVYAEASARVRSALTDRPAFIGLAQVIERIGRLAGQIVVPQPATPDPVPAWLADRLVHTVGLTRQEVAAMDLREAVDRWTVFVSRPNPDEPA
jgi:mRNA interferase RelE/StbE